MSEHRISHSSRKHRCISEEQMLELVSGGIAEAEAGLMLREIEGCAQCVILLAEAGQGMVDAPCTLPGALAFELGDVLAQRYQIVNCLGRGGMGEVYEAMDLQLQQTVALKTIRGELSEQPNAVGRFKQELHIARRIMHPNICRVFELGSELLSDGRTIHFITMEYLNGQLLGARLREQGYRGSIWALNVAGQLASGLSEIHALGVIHRDVKPDNVMLCTRPDGVVYPVLLDFGAARSPERFEGLQTTRRGVAIGTPDYMAPEQVAGLRPTAACDIYSLGLVMYQLLTGTLPFSRATSLKEAMERLGQKVPAPSRRNPEICSSLDALVLACLEVEPTERPSAAQLCEMIAIELRSGRGLP